ncbi:TPA: IS5/IS1182 family transposase, partial [Streptococcus agalactiae]
LNIKKLVKMMTGKTCYFTQISQYYWFMGEFGKNIKKTNIKNDVCLHSDRKAKPSYFVENKIYFRKNYEKK